MATSRRSTIQRRSKGQSDHPCNSVVPGSWQLARRSETGKVEILARGVLAYDIATDGTIAYSNGSAIFVISPEGKKERVVSERMIEQVVLLNG